MWIRSELSENCFHSIVVKIILITYAKKKPYSCLGWWESTKWISWKEFAQTGREKVCDKVKIKKTSVKISVVKNHINKFCLKKKKTFLNKKLKKKIASIVLSKSY